MIYTYILFLDKGYTPTEELYTTPNLPQVPHVELYTTPEEACTHNVQHTPGYLLTPGVYLFSQIIL